MSDYQGTYTTNLNLSKDNENDSYDVNRVNSNSEKIDNWAGEVNTDISTLKTNVANNTSSLNALTNNIKNYGHFGISANLSVANSTSTIGLALDTSIVSNIDLYTLENNQITIKQDGVYIIEFGVEFEKNSTGLRDIRIYGNSIPIGATSVMAVDALSTKLNVRAIANLSAGQKIYGSVIQNSGGALNIASGNFTYLKIRKLA